MFIWGLFPVFFWNLATGEVVDAQTDGLENKVTPMKTNEFNITKLSVKLGWVQANSFNPILLTR